MSYCYYYDRIVRKYSIRDEGWPDLVVLISEKGEVLETYWAKDITPFPEFDYTTATNEQVFAIERMTDF